MRIEKNSLKRFFLLSVLLGWAMILPASNFQQAGEEKNASYAVDRVSHNFGTIKEKGGKATTVFTLTNHNKTPLVINQVKTSCGCTTTSYTKQPIERGKKGTITIVYDPAGRIYPFNKAITVITNGIPAVTVLHIIGNVVK